MRRCRQSSFSSCHRNSTESSTVGNTLIPNGSSPTRSNIMSCSMISVKEMSRGARVCLMCSLISVFLVSLVMFSSFFFFFIKLLHRQQSHMPHIMVKGIVHPKIVNAVIIYSASRHSKPATSVYSYKDWFQKEFKSTIKIVHRTVF